MKESSRLLRVGWKYDFSFEVGAFSLSYRIVEFLFVFFNWGKLGLRQLI